MNPAGSMVGATVSLGDGVSEGDDVSTTKVDVAAPGSIGAEVATVVPWQAVKANTKTDRNTSKERILSPQKDFANFT